MKDRLPSLRRLLRAFRRDTAAATASEFALVVPVFILMVFGTINTCLALAAVINVHYAAERAARCMSVGTTGPCTSANVDAYAKDWYRGPGVNSLNFAWSSQTCGNRVIGTGSYNIITGFNATAVSISAQACYPVI
jgi:Flp pilus assembly protein TadG